MLYGGVLTATHAEPASLRNDAAPTTSDFHTRRSAQRCANPAVQRRAAALPAAALPNNKLIPDARWILDSAASTTSSRAARRAPTSPRARTRSRPHQRGSVAVYPLGSAVFYEAIVDVGDDPRDQIPLAGFKRIYTSRYYAVYGNC